MMTWFDVFRIDDKSGLIAEHWDSSERWGSSGRPPGAEFFPYSASPVKSIPSRFAHRVRAATAWSPGLRLMLRQRTFTVSRRSA